MEAVPLPDVKVYLSESTVVIGNPLEFSIALAVNPSKDSTSLKHTVSPVLLPLPGSVTVITADPLAPDVKGLKGRSTVVGGSVLSGLLIRNACGSLVWYFGISCGCFG